MTYMHSMETDDSNFGCFDRTRFARNRTICIRGDMWLATVIPLRCIEAIHVEVLDWRYNCPMWSTQKFPADLEKLWKLKRDVIDRVRWANQSCPATSCFQSEDDDDPKRQTMGRNVQCAHRAKNFWWMAADAWQQKERERTGDFETMQCPKSAIRRRSTRTMLKDSKGQSQPARTTPRFGRMNGATLWPIRRWWWLCFDQDVDKLMHYHF